MHMYRGLRAPFLIRESSVGRFSSETVYTVSTSTSRVVKDEAMPNTVLQGALKAIIHNTNIAEEVAESLFSSAGFNITQMCEKASEIYPKGQMRGRVVGNYDHIPLIERAIEKEKGHPVELDYGVLAPLNYIHAAWDELTKNYGYERYTNTLKSFRTEEGQPAYLHSFVVLLPTSKFNRAVETGGTVSLGDPPDSGYTPNRPAMTENLRPYADNTPGVTEDADRTDVLVRAAYVIGDPGDSITVGDFEFTLDLEGDSDMEFYQAMYRTPQGDTRYWSYRYGEGRHPELDTRYEASQADPGEYMPVIYFRLGGQNVADPTNAGDEDYDAATKITDMMGMNYSDIGEAIHENPDIDKVRNAYMMFGASPEDDDPVVARYLHAFFADLYTRAGAGEPSFYTKFGKPYVHFHTSLVLAPEGALEGSRVGANMTLSVSGLSRRLRIGKVAEVGDAVKSKGTHSGTFSYMKKDFKHNDDQETTYSKRVEEYTFKTLILKKQISASVYEEVTVIRPRLRHTVDASDRGTNNHLGDPDLLIPLDRRLIEGWSIGDKETLYLHSLHFVFNSRDKQKIKWYETSLFQFVLQAVTIVLTVVSMGNAAPAVAAAFAAGGLTAAAVVVVTAVVKALAIQQGLKLVAEEAGAEAAFAVAIVAMIYGSYKGFQAGSLKNAPWASELVQASTGLAKAGAGVIQDQLEEVYQEMEVLSDRAEEAYGKLEEANSLLDSTSLLDPLEYIGLQPVILPGETPQNFYQRTIHSGNIGVMAIDAIHHYVDTSLKLPDFQDTAQEILYG